jgi:hypothetical protein
MPHRCSDRPTLSGRSGLTPAGLEPIGESPNGLTMQDLLFLTQNSYAPKYRSTGKYKKHMNKRFGLPCAFSRYAPDA